MAQHASLATYSHEKIASVISIIHEKLESVIPISYEKITSVIPISHEKIALVIPISDDYDEESSISEWWWLDMGYPLQLCNALSLLQIAIFYVRTYVLYVCTYVR